MYITANKLRYLGYDRREASNLIQKLIRWGAYSENRKEVVKAGNRYGFCVATMFTIHIKADEVLRTIQFILDTPRYHHNSSLSSRYENLRDLIKEQL